MPTTISIPNGYTGESSIIVTPTVILLLFPKKELNHPELSNYLKQTGIYILYNQEQLYVGQSSNKEGLITRLRKHEYEKLWWEKTLVILPTQLMTKAHYDYIERTYIQIMSQRNHLMNQNSGNDSPITPLEMEQCEVLMGTKFVSSLGYRDYFTSENANKLHANGIKFEIYKNMIYLYFDNKDNKNLDELVNYIKFMADYLFNFD